MSAIIDFGLGRVSQYASIIAAQGAALAFRGGRATVINLWTPIDNWQFAAYSPVQTYSAGQSVSYFNRHYTCDVNGTLGVTPGTDPLRWSLNANQPQIVSGLNTTDGTPSQGYLPITSLPSGAAMTIKGFNDAGAVDPNPTTIQPSVAFQCPELALLFISGMQVPYVTGTVG